jgi:hypothetical protein
MEITNKHNLPAPIIKLLSKEYHKKGDYSATELVYSVRKRILMDRHNDNITVDASDQLHRIEGQLMHYALERGECDNQIVEEYLTVNVLGKVITGRPDSYMDNAIQDYKYVKVYGYILGSSKPNYESQLNIYDYMFKQQNINAERLENIYWFKDWSEMKAQTDKSYPQTHVLTHPVKKWSTEEQLKYITDRVKLFEDSKKLSDSDLPECTPSEKWHKPDKWAVKKTGNKKATKLCDSEKDAQIYMIEKNKVKGYEIIFRPGENTMCESKCECRLFCKYR